MRLRDSFRRAGKEKFKQSTGASRWMLGEKLPPEKEC